jgi:hypothetical protein
VWRCAIIVGDMQPRSQPHDELWGLVRQRLIDEGLTPQRAEDLATALLDADSRPAALEELNDRLDRLTDVIERLETQVEHLDAAAPSEQAATQPVEPSGADDHERFRHPILAAEHEVEHLREVADKGESAATPAIVTSGVILFLIPIVVIVIALAFAAYYVARDSGSSESAAAPVPWSLPNGDLFNTRHTRGTSISSANVSQLDVAWTMPLTANSTYGTFAANPVTSPDGWVYLQDLESNVFAVDLQTEATENPA